MRKICQFDRFVIFRQVWKLIRSEKSVTHFPSTHPHTLTWSQTYYLPSLPSSSFFTFPFPQSNLNTKPFDGHECSEDSLASAIIKWLCVPVDCWPTSLPWTCGSCHTVQEGRVCASCPGSTRIRALLLLLQGLAYTLQAILPIILVGPVSAKEEEGILGFKA